MSVQSSSQSGGAAVSSSGRDYQLLKRAIDLIVATLLLLLLSPVLLALALAIRLDSPGPALFRQKRVGRDGREFVAYKFRSMCRDADSSTHVAAFRRWMSNRPIAEGDGTTFKLKHDARVTRAGALLRKTSLDELPQLINVLKGDMSLVGPRPPIAYEVALYQDWHRARLSVTPGITGLWQVKARGISDFEGMVRLDLEYIAKQSLWLDLKIIAMTVPAVLFGKGAR